MSGWRNLRRADGDREAARQAHVARALALLYAWETAAPADSWISAAKCHPASVRDVSYLTAIDYHGRIVAAELIAAWVRR